LSLTDRSLSRREFIGNVKFYREATEEKRGTFVFRYQVLNLCLKCLAL
jgi:hypothetical protein